MLSKSEKIKFVESMKKELGSYKIVGVVEFNGLPDRLVQKTKNSLKPETRFVMGRKKLLQKVLEGHPNCKQLEEGLTGTSAIVLSNEDPFVLYKRFKSNKIKLAAKPGQIAPSDVHVQSGETSVMPGQAVTELKSAGIDVQIQKGKVVIAKDKVLVKKGEPISLLAAKALHTLEVYPFSAVADPLFMSDGSMLYSRAVLGIDAETTTRMMAEAFANALAVSLKGAIINRYTINTLISRAYCNAMALGTEAKLYDSGIIEGLISMAIREAGSISGMVKPQPSQ
jgi:large subunit ribosomal protein L10